MNLLHDLPARPAHTDGRVHVVVETPGGSSNKLKYDPELEVFCLSRSLTEGLHFPYDYGFIPRTRSGDGEALDVLVLMDAPTAPGVVLQVRLLGGLALRSAGRVNDRLVGTAMKAWREEASGPRTLETPRFRQELEIFFTALAAPTGKTVELKGWYGAEKAEALVKRAERDYGRPTARSRSAARR